MPPWTALPHAATGFDHDAEALRSLWPALHAGDLEPCPADPAALEAWRHFHAGRFEAACEAGLAAGDAGAHAADRARLAQAQYVEASEATRARLFEEVAQRAGERLERHPDDANDHHLLATALARRIQGVPIGRLLAQGLVGRIRALYEGAIALAPMHVPAHAALGTFHAEVIDQLGAIVGRTQGVGKGSAVALLRTAARLDPTSVSARIALADGLLMCEGDARLDEATALYQAAAAHAPRDAVEALEVAIARQALGE